MKAIQGYVHHDKSFGVLVEFEIGTDFTARTPEFKALAERVAMAFGLNDLRAEAGKIPVEELCLDDRIAFTTMTDSDETIVDVLIIASKTFHEPIRVTRVWDTRIMHGTPKKLSAAFYDRARAAGPLAGGVLAVGPKLAERALGKQSVTMSSERDRAIAEAVREACRRYGGTGMDDIDKGGCLDLDAIIAAVDAQHPAPTRVAEPSDEEREAADAVVEAAVLRRGNMLRAGPTARVTQSVADWESAVDRLLAIRASHVPTDEARTQPGYSVRPHVEESVARRASLVKAAETALRTTGPEPVSAREVRVRDALEKLLRDVIPDGYELNLDTHDDDGNAVDPIDAEGDCSHGAHGPWCREWSKMKKNLKTLAEASQHFISVLDKFEDTEDLNDNIEKASYEVDRCRGLLNAALAAVRD